MPRTLAQRSADAAKQVKMLIGDSAESLKQQAANLTDVMSTFRFKAS